jgi:hypothetical protein
VYPGIANLEAVFTALSAGCYFMDLIQVCAVHDFLDTTVGLATTEAQKFTSFRARKPPRGLTTLGKDYIKVLIHPPSTGIDVPVM